MPSRPPAVREKPSPTQEKPSQSLAWHRGTVSRFVVNSIHSFIEKIAECVSAVGCLIACLHKLHKDEGSTVVPSTCLAGHQVTDEGARWRSQSMALRVGSAVTPNLSCSTGRSQGSSLAASAWLWAHTDEKRALTLLLSFVFWTPIGLDVTAPGQQPPFRPLSVPFRPLSARPWEASVEDQISTQGLLREHFLSP